MELVPCKLAYATSGKNLYFSSTKQFSFELLQVNINYLVTIYESSCYIDIISDIATIQI